MSASAAQAARAKLATPQVLGEVKGTVINSAVSRKRLPISGSGAMAPVRAAAMRANAAVPAKTELVLSDIQFTQHPGKQFAVILERRDDPSKRVRVGTLSFFDSGEAGHEHDAKIDRRFDVTDELHQIAASGAALNELNVVFEVTTGRITPGDDEVSFDEEDTRLTVGEIELVVSAADQ